MKTKSTPFTLQLCAGCCVSSSGCSLHAAAAEGWLRRGARHPHTADGCRQLWRHSGHHGVHHLFGHGLCYRWPFFFFFNVCRLLEKTRCCTFFSNTTFPNTLFSLKQRRSTLRSTSQTVAVVSQELSRGCECIMYFLFSLCTSQLMAQVHQKCAFNLMTVFSLLGVLGSTWYNLLRGVLEVAGGMVAGILLGFIIQYFPSVDQVGVLSQP